MKYLIGVGLVLVLAALAAAGVYMLRDGRDGQPRSAKMARALAVRVGLSVLIFVLILVSYLMGWIQPSGVPLQR